MHQMKDFEDDPDGHLWATLAGISTLDRDKLKNDARFSKLARMASKSRHREILAAEIRKVITEYTNVADPVVFIEHPKESCFIQILAPHLMLVFSVDIDGNIS